MLNNGWFTVGQVSFLAETERKDGKGSYLVVYVRFGSEKSQVTKAKVWAKDYVALDGKFKVRDVSGAWADIEVGSDLTAYGNLGTYEDAKGVTQLSYVITETAGLKVSEVVEA